MRRPRPAFAAAPPPGAAAAAGGISLIDFGSARFGPRVGDKGVLAKLYAMPPEQYSFRSHRTQYSGLAADMWAVGAMLFSMVELADPYKAGLGAGGWGLGFGEG